MTTRHSLVVFLVLLVLPEPAADAAAPWVRPEPLKGVVVGGHVLTFHQEKPAKEKGFGEHQVRFGKGEVVGWVASLGAEGEPKRVVCPGWWGGVDLVPPRWQIGHGACWVSR